jgi:hypothetical protein
MSAPRQGGLAEPSVRRVQNQKFARSYWQKQNSVLYTEGRRNEAPMGRREANCR